MWHRTESDDQECSKFLVLMVGGSDSFCDEIFNGLVIPIPMTKRKYMLVAYLMAVFVTYDTEMTRWFISAWLQYLQCISNGVSAVLH